MHTVPVLQCIGTLKSWYCVQSVFHNSTIHMYLYTEVLLILHTVKSI